jgi:hypothetical protein
MEERFYRVTKGRVVVGILFEDEEDGRWAL